MQRYVELHGSSKYKDVFDQKFLDGLEKRRELLEGRNFKVLAIQIPLFLLLAVSLINQDVKLSIVGFSIDGARGLREILLVITSILGLMASGFNRELGDIKEIMKGAVEKLSQGNADSREFLNVRYGLSEFAYGRTFDPHLHTGNFHLVWAVLILMPMLLLLGALVGVALSVQFLNLREILLHPNFSPTVSVMVIVFVAAVDLVIGVTAWLRRGPQPFQTLEDSNKLSRLEWKDRAKYDAIINDIVKRHLAKGTIRRLLTRPKMKRLD
jgi:hypothetical protein